MYSMPGNQFSCNTKLLRSALQHEYSVGLRFTQSDKVARYSFPGPMPPKFEHKLRRHKQSFENIAATVVLDKDENLS